METVKNKNRISFLKKKDNDEFGELSPFITMGWQIAITVLFCIALGWWLDKHFSTHPLFIIILSILGIFAALLNYINTAMKVVKVEENNIKIHSKHI
jgi:predicted F0F1-ATPase subunit